MPDLKINFVDFWPGFDKEDNYFFILLSQKYRLTICEDPDILFYSCYGKKYLEYKCVRIFYSSENLRPDFTGCDFALTFDFLDDPRHFRLPLYGLYLGPRRVHDLLKETTTEQAVELWNSKPDFCCMVVSNGLAKKRIEFFERLSRYRKVDSGGRYMNNIGGPVADKMEFIKKYKFVIAFENSSHPGYTTEKILQPLIVHSIPVYWGNPVIDRDFNNHAFINYDQFGSDEKVIKEMLEIEKKPERAIEMLAQPRFPQNQIPHYIREERVMDFLIQIINRLPSIHPVARRNIRFLHAVLTKKQTMQHYINQKIGRNFR